MGNIPSVFKFVFFFIIPVLSATAQVTPGAAEPKTLEHTFYLAGNIGNDLTGEGQKIISALVKASQKDENATLLIPGNFLPPKGYEEEGEREAQQQFLKKNLLDAVREFNVK